MATLQHYLGDPEVRRLAWQNRLRSAAWEARPNLGHTAIVALQERGQLHGLITQNVDGLHQLAGVRADAVIEVNVLAVIVRDRPALAPDVKRIAHELLVEVNSAVIRFGAQVMTVVVDDTTAPE